MKTYARMEQGRVVEIIEPFFQVVEEHIDEAGSVVPRAEHEVPIEERFHPDILALLIEYDPEHPPAPPPEPVVVPVSPPRVTMRQGRLALLAAGKLGAVEAAIDSLPSPTKEAARIEWEYAATVDRDSVFVGQLASMLNLDAAQLDALFLQAATL